MTFVVSSTKRVSYVKSRVFNARGPKWFRFIVLSISSNVTKNQMLLISNYFNFLP